MAIQCPSKSTQSLQYLRIMLKDDFSLIEYLMKFVGSLLRGQHLNPGQVVRVRPWVVGDQDQVCGCYWVRTSFPKRT